MSPFERDRADQSVRLPSRASLSKQYFLKQSLTKFIPSYNLNSMRWCNTDGIVSRVCVLKGLHCTQPSLMVHGGCEYSNIQHYQAILKPTISTAAARVQPNLDQECKCDSTIYGVRQQMPRLPTVQNCSVSQRPEVCDFAPNNTTEPLDWGLPFPNH